jgi:hypothetical protein
MENKLAILTMEEVKAKEFGLSLNKQLETLSMHNKELELLLQTANGNRRQVEQSLVSKIVELEGVQATIH